MRYLKYRTNNAISVLTNNVEQNLELTPENIESSSPLILEPKKIIELLTAIKNDKFRFKKLISLFHKMDQKDFLILANQFYSINNFQLQKQIFEELEERYPYIKEIKTDMYVHNGEYSKAKAIVYAKKGVRINPFKVYSAEELKQMINCGDIVVKYAEPYGKTYETTPANVSLISPLTLIDALSFEELTEEVYNDLMQHCPRAIDLLLAYTSLAEIKQDCELQYLPVYKQCLKFLTECAKVSVVHEEEVRKGLRRQIEKSNDISKEYSSVVKAIEDSSKGR